MFLGRFSRLWWPTLQTRQAAHVVNTWHVVYPHMYPQMYVQPHFFHVRLDEHPWNGGLLWFIWSKAMCKNDHSAPSTLFVNPESWRTIPWIFSRAWMARMVPARKLCPWIWQLIWQLIGVFHAINWGSTGSTHWLFPWHVFWILRMTGLRIDCNFRC